MKLDKLRISHFQSYGSTPTELSFDDLTFLIGPNGSGKTAALQALCRMFAFDPSLRRIKKSDFHVPCNETEHPEERTLWIEADFLFPELHEEADSTTVPPHFAHMRLVDGEDIPRVRFRLEASMGIDGDIDESLIYVLELDENQQPHSTAKVSRIDRNQIQIHYLPARRDPAEHITFGSNALLGRMLRAVNWEVERETVKGHTDQISSSLDANISVNALSTSIQKSWSCLHKGQFFTQPKITFVASEIESLLRHLSISFAPGHDEANVDFSRLSDGQKSMLYLSLVLSSQAIGRSVLKGDDSFDPDKLRPAVFTLIAVEEPENSLSPHYLGRIVSSLQEMLGHGDAQALIATHAPSMLRRIEPKQIRYMRLNSDRETTIASINIPDEEHYGDAHKFVTQAVKAFPEIYFSRLVILGEGDSEEIVIPRLLEVKEVPVDAFGITVAPLGGRHVNHFWRLLEGLNIPHITLLDLDVGRYQGGWGRIKTTNDQLILHKPALQLTDGFTVIPRWDDSDHKIRDFHHYLEEMEKRRVFFSYPMDLDFAMLRAFPTAFNIEIDDQVEPELPQIKAVLGKSRTEASEYDDEERKLFITYHKLFKIGSKPAEHISALSKLSDEQLLVNIPPSLERLVEAAKEILLELPE
ncbi:putative ATP-dependent endonuclease of the OLD family [Vibrio crassostreae]|uniref:ATP-dependent nuclease n=1 Tax=Vibrio TaxID=662 RepID=UPI000319E34C|nr:MULTISPECIES: AAA family ATPase [Vibrio]CAK2466536.1 putative ATP-dependent endonuclease of the OLD family [Vibrio crassostreae]MDH5880131.1 AAA family ATPase [Vibrio sp. S/42/10]OED70868.1 ATP-dependent endonuclease [Vibrio cyclitrophicus ZF99]PMK90716.1 ATP-dependent endonuclease [Vibrio lentus]CAK2566038.1 putative ATP-dependent endonuclease of the OLD family [Vibrio crassostreae]